MKLFENCFRRAKNVSSSSFKGQSSMELLVTFGIILAFSIPVLFLLYSLTSVGSENAAKVQADATVRSLADSFNLVYAQGPNAKRSVLLNLPASTEYLNVSNGEITLRLKTSRGVYDVSAPTYALIYRGNPVFSGKTGLFPVTVENDGPVRGVRLVDPNALS